ncbi:MAG: acyl-CoA thioesterase [Chloroflexi bacterium]|nr:acyl-CoA thioesterase [Chloroflexota bacterium]
MNKPRVVESEIRVRYAETDAEGVVYYANYFVYMEVGRVNYLRALGLNRSIWQQSGLGLVIVEAYCRYHAPAHFDDRLIVRTWVEEVRHSSFALAYEIVHAEDRRLLASGRTVQVLVSLQDMRPIRLPPEVQAALCSALESAGEQ